MADAPLRKKNFRLLVAFFRSTILAKQIVMTDNWLRSFSGSVLP
jgi:nitrogen fixation protein FixH